MDSGCGANDERVDDYPHCRRGAIVVSSEDRAALAQLEVRLNTLLPEEYRGAVDVQPTPMGSAAVRYDADGRVAWDEMWGSFCDLAVAGGPPHKGRLLQPGAAAEIRSVPEQQAEVVREICRGVRMVADVEGARALHHQSRQRGREGGLEEPVHPGDPVLRRLPDRRPARGDPGGALSP